MSWYILRANDVVGPIDDKEIDHKLVHGEIGAEAMVGRSADGPWGPASAIFPLAFGIISVTAMPPVIPTDHARRVMAQSTPAVRPAKTAPVPLGVSPSASSAEEMRKSGDKPN